MNQLVCNDSLEPHSSDETQLEKFGLSRKLSEEELEKLQKQMLASDFRRKKLQEEVRKNWDKFYLRNKAKFFKDRCWALNDFDGFLKLHVNLKDNLNFLEAGCGAGNLLFPLKQFYSHWNFYAFDFSHNAVRLLLDRSKANNLPVNAAVADLTDDNFSLSVPKCDIATMIFVLSAISPQNQQKAVRNLSKFVKSQGVVIVRDYGINDYAMVRFGRQCKLGERFYARQDGTMAYYFIKGELDDLFGHEGFHKVTSSYLLRKTVNRQKNVVVDRVFVQAVYIKS